jgi:hypothetical protein
MPEPPPIDARDLALLRQEIVAEKELTAERFKARDLAVDKALAEQNARLNGMNEFRQALQDQSAQMLTRTNFELVNSAMVDRLTKLETSQANWIGRASVVGVAWTVLSALLVWFLTRHGP